MVSCFLSAFLLCSAVLFGEIRAAIDIGMGGPKLQIADVDAHKIVKTLHSQNYFVNFYEGISKADGRLSSEVMQQGFKACADAIAVARSFGAERIVAIATASLRSASNGVEFAQTLAGETGVAVHVVDQSLEGKLAFATVLSRLDGEDLVVLDIGGGSVQLIGTQPDGSVVVDCGNESVGAFLDYIIRNIQCLNREECKTPNPMSASDISEAAAYAQKISQRVDGFFKEKLNSPETKVIGVGSVLGHGISAMMGKNAFSLAEIAEVVHGLAGKTDADFGGGAYAFCEVSNTVFVLGFMQGLGIQHLEIVNINNAEGVLVYQPFWQGDLCLEF